MMRFIVSNNDTNNIQNIQQYQHIHPSQHLHNLNPNQHSTFHDQQQSYILPHIKDVNGTITNNNNINNNSNGAINMPPPHVPLQIQKLNGFINQSPIYQRNYTYNNSNSMENHNINTPLTPNNSNSNSYQEAIRLPRVLPTPDYSQQIQYFNFQPVSAANSNNNTPQPQISLQQQQVPSSIIPIDEHRRHSINIGTLEDKYTPHSLSIIRPNSQSDLHDAFINKQRELIKQNKTVIKINNKESSSMGKNKITKKKVNHAVGEKYNDMGQLIGKSGKPLKDTRRAAQNRYAQKAFRIRRDKHIKELEEKAKKFDSLVQENERLKQVINELKSSKDS